MRIFVVQVMIRSTWSNFSTCSVKLTREAWLPSLYTMKLSLVASRQEACAGAVRTNASTAQTNSRTGALRHTGPPPAPIGM